MLMVNNLDNYLGLPFPIRKKKTIAFSSIINRFSCRINSWSKRLLSYCGWSMLAWDRMCHPKGMGGLGFCDLRLFNLALLGRQVWRLTQFKDTLCYKVLSSKYFPNRDIFRPKVVDKPLYTWSSIANAAKALENSFVWLVGDGKSIDIRNDNWVCKSSPTITHLFFADDSFLFFKATRSECSLVKTILDVYEQASGQAGNFKKSRIFFSQNKIEGVRWELFDILGVHTPLDHGRYLGLPSLVGHTKRSIFSFLRERMWSCIQNWNNKLLSRANKEILLKSIAQAILSYCMSTFLLPISLYDELQRIMNSFWWGMKDNGGSTIYWYRWHPRLAANPSFTWRSIFKAKDVLAARLRWKFGSVENITRS
ncbi:LINE-1 reverse transcriptase isogeny [Gossypium australe]|uniref:LINE-1 reverse transcriptase isogeny n=1 Tax=Gossypium australe TaxID=47621 RepID=A0A5B6WPR9_9ROSI|nr:LINE-1 reverse transcriptase isogeny [Gossypium australe]